MTLPPEFYRKTYDPNHYNCSHFAVDVYRYYFKSDIVNDLACFLLPEKERYADMSIRRKFTRIPCHKQTARGDIVVLHTHKGYTHVAIKIDDEYIQLGKDGVVVVSWELLNIGFKRAKVYRHVSNSIRL